MKKAINSFLIFLAKIHCPHRWLQGFAVNELCLGATDNFVKKSILASTSQIRQNQTKLAHEAPSGSLPQKISGLLGQWEP